MGERPRRGTFDFCAVRPEFAPVARARNHLRISLPLRYAPKVRADRGDRIETLRHTHDVNLLVLEKSDGMNWIQIRIARPERRRRFKKDIGRKILIGYGDRPKSRDPESAQRDFIQEITPGDPVARLCRAGCLGDRRICCVAHTCRTIFSIWTKLGSRSNTSYVSMVIVFAGLRYAQRR